jgi:hypothetical protein
MDTLAALENMALNATTALSYSTGDLPEKCIARWISMFGYDRERAMEKIQEHRNEFSRRRLPDEHWELIRSAETARGHDKESYEYSLHLQSMKNGISRSQDSAHKTPEKRLFLLKLDGPLGTPDIVRKVAKLNEIPRALPTTTDSESNGTFIIVNGATKDVILQTFAEQIFQPFFQQYNKAEKALSSTTLFPTLGIDSTLPQFRISGVPWPKQNQYPVYYFFTAA